MGMAKGVWEMIARNERAQLDGQIAMRLSEARIKRDSFEVHSTNWWYWRGKCEAYKTMRKIVFSAWKRKAAGK